MFLGLDLTPTWRDEMFLGLNPTPIPPSSVWRDEMFLGLNLTPIIIIQRDEMFLGLTSIQLPSTRRDEIFLGLDPRALSKQKEIGSITSKQYAKETGTSLILLIGVTIRRTSR